MRALSVALAGLFLISAVSGCLGGDEGTPSTANDASPSPTGTSAAGTNGTTAPENQPPVAALTVLVNGTAVELVNGTATVPADTDVTFSARGSTDPEGANLTFSWTIDGNATGLAAADQNATLAAGNHTVTVVVDDGSARDDETLAVVAVGDEAGPSVGPTGAIATRFTGSFAAGSSYPAAGTARVAKTFDVPAGAQGLTVSLFWTQSGVRTSLTGDLDLRVYDPKGTAIATALTILLNHEYIRLSDPTKLVEGTWKAEVEAYAVPAGVAWTLDTIVWAGLPVSTTFKGSAQGAANEPPASTGTIKHKNGKTVNDFDLYATRAGKAEFNSGGFAVTEFGYKAAGEGESLGGEWEFEVRPYTVAQADYTLLVEYA
ncbi:MAG: hypothetical protein HYT80_11615 [Euryarchaeota archaeon]|nr:hypothetical protein [Euryarchaeota archaeon]